jgi:hypothetical protein
MRAVVIVFFIIVAATAHATQFVPDELIDEGPGPAVYEYDERYGDRTGGSVRRRGPLHLDASGP